MNTQNHTYQLPLDLPFSHTQILRQWHLPSHYQICKILGQGAYGCVVQAFNNETNQWVAIKRITRLFSSLDDTKRILREITLLRKMNHPNVIKIIDLFIEGDDYQTFNTIYVVMEYFPSDLKKLLRSPIYLTHKHIRLLSYNILQALQYLHSVSILHRDLKPENILINEDCQVKLCDFGLARAIGYSDNESNESNELNSSAERKSDEDTNSPEMSSPEIKKFKQKIQVIFESDEINNQNENNNNNSNNKIQQQQPLLNLAKNTIYKKVQEINQQQQEQLKLQQQEQIASNEILHTPPLLHKKSMDQHFESHYQQQQQQQQNKQLNQLQSQTQIQKNGMIFNSRARIQSADGIEFQSGKKMKRSPKRGLTKHVVTRWYRAPEIILVEKNYSEAIDIWSFGCIFAELQNTMKENVQDYKKRKALFPGNSCFPLSPKIDKPINNEESKKKEFPRQREDQLNLIFSIIGTPQEQDVNFVTDKNAVTYLQSFKSREKKNFRTLYPASNKDAIQILDQTLQFNPNSRIALDELINLDYFASFKQENKFEQNEPIEMDFENEDELSHDLLRKYFIDELKLYQIF